MTVALVIAVVALGGVAYATIPDSVGTIHGCYGKSSGNLRVVESGSDCRNSENALAWNQRGPTGPTGPQGPPGTGVGSGNVFTKASTAAPGEIITLAEIPGVARLTLRCPGPDDFTGGITNYHYTAVNLLADQTLHVDAPALGLREIPPNSSLIQITTLHQQSIQFALLEAGKVGNGFMTLYTQPTNSDRGSGCLYAAQTLLSDSG